MRRGFWLRSVLASSFVLSLWAQPRLPVWADSALPPCRLDSFVHSAGGSAEHIYGDEGMGEVKSGETSTNRLKLPPYFGFTVEHRINAGMVGQTGQGLTTGHGSRLPDAWGRDEFTGGTEWSQAGATGSDGNQSLPLDMVAHSTDVLASNHETGEGATLSAGLVSVTSGHDDFDLRDLQIDF